MKKTVSLRTNKDFSRVYKKGTYKSGEYIVVYAEKNKFGKSMLGITVGKKVGNSVQRSRFTRLVRESYRLLEDSVKDGYNIIVYAKPLRREAIARNRKIKAVSLPEFYRIDDEMKKLFSKLNLLKDETK